MKTSPLSFHSLAVLAAALVGLDAYAADHFVSLTGGHVPPFTNWADAATNIQSAIDAASAGETVWVTNGVYATGGKVMDGDLTNRVVLDKALTVQSVNGPLVTSIQGGGATNGTRAIRCAWLTNGATLKGFAIQGGATRTAGDASTLRNGGGIWCASPSAVVANCLIQSNAAFNMGGGVFQGMVINSVLRQNSAQAGSGCASNILNSCTVVSNSTSGTFGCAMTNSISYFNAIANYFGTQPIVYCCTAPMPAGLPGNSNITDNPQFIEDGFHLSTTSPCRGAGTNLVAGTDIDGQNWLNRPSIGCDEWREAPVVFSQPKSQVSSEPIGFRISLAAVGQDPFTCYWFRDGIPIEHDGVYSSAHSTNLVVSGADLSCAGGYQAVVSNAFGMATSAVLQLVFHCVDAACISPVSPYASWANAATNIQDAINSASSGEIILVTNGVYFYGGKAMGNDLTNLVAIDKPLLVHAMNGPATVTIDGSSFTNGAAAVRCAWLTNGAVLSGIQLRNGATRATGNFGDQQNYGGGVWGASTNAMLVNCFISTNYAFYAGGGAYQVSLVNCRLVGNQAVGSGSPSGGAANAGVGGGSANCILKNCILDGNAAIQGYGGGAYNSALRNCYLTRNSSYLYGGAAYQGTLVNCTITANLSGGYSSGVGGGAVANATLTNCIAHGNVIRFPATIYTNHYNSTFAYSCTTPTVTGEGNISMDPLLLADGLHLAEGSPCRGAGTNAVIFGVDIDGQSWTNPPPMGCDEWQAIPQAITSPQVGVESSGTVKLGGSVAAGAQPFSLIWMKDGVPLTATPRYNSVNTSNLIIYGLDPADAGNYQVAFSNSFGTATSAVVRIVVHCVSPSSVAPAEPYSSWASAADDIQSAVNAASEGDFVLVTNGVYSTGGKAMFGDLANRVAVDKAVTVMSIKGPSSTFIQGAWDPVSTNGPLAVRSVWLTNGASLVGFTVQGGATRTNGNAAYLLSGGGVWAASSSSSLVNCIVVSNAAYTYGGGVYSGKALNTLVRANISSSYGGGVYGSLLANCTVVGNSSRLQGGGVYDAYLAINCIFYSNTSALGSSSANYFYSAPIPAFIYSCATPFRSGPGNISSDPQLMDSYHLASTSPCRGAATNVTIGTDLDGESWTNPPSMGCDDVCETGVTGSLAVAVSAPWPVVAERGSLPLNGQVTGWASRVGWDYGDGSILTNASLLSTSHVWTNAGDYTVTFTAFNADNPGGVSTNLLVHVVPLEAPIITTGGLSGTNFSLGFPGQPGVTYMVEQATNLDAPVTWQTVGTVFSTGGVMQVVDVKATNNMRFYRVKGP